jgi:hypothetical protein
MDGLAMEGVESRGADIRFRHFGGCGLSDSIQNVVLDVHAIGVVS